MEKQHFRNKSALLKNMSASCQKETDNTPATVSTMESTSSTVKRQDMPYSPILDGSYENRIVLVQENECHLTASIKSEQLRDVHVKQEPSEDILSSEEQGYSPILDGGYENRIVLVQENEFHLNASIKSEHLQVKQEPSEDIVLSEEQGYSPILDGAYQNRIVLVHENECHLTASIKSEQLQDVQVKQEPNEDVFLSEEQDCNIQGEQPLLMCQNKAEWNSSTPDVPEQPLEDLRTAALTTVLGEGAKHAENCCLRDEDEISNYESFSLAHTVSPDQEDSGLVPSSELTESTQTTSELQHLNRGTCRTIRNATTEVPWHPSASHVKCSNGAVLYPEESIRTDQAHCQKGDGVKLRSCHLCAATYKTLGGLKYHLNRHKGIKPFRCRYCSHRCILKEDLESHIHSRHSDKRPFKCDLCDKAFATREVLTVHRRIHTGEKPYACRHCPAAFIDGSGLRVHMLSTHSTERPHICEHCGKSFAMRHRLKRHKITHTDNTPHLCHLCPARYTMQASLVVHLRSHSNERPYACEQCGKGFATSGRRAAHIKSMHSSEPAFTCKVCHKKYKHKGSLHVHLRDYHPAEAKS